MNEISFIAVGIAIASLILNFWTARSSSNSADASKTSARSAEAAVHVAQKSADAAVRSAEAAEKSNLIARESIELQRAQIVATEEECTRTLKAELTPLYWEGRVRHEYRGLVIENVGLGAAREIRAVTNWGGRAEAWVWPSLGGLRKQGS
jgi:hypothetical protein